MEKGFNHLKIASIINFIFAALLYSIFSKYSFILVIIGLVTLYFTSFNLEQLNKSKGWIIFIGILLVFMNFISGIFVLIGYDHLQGYLKENKDKLKAKEVIDKETKKIDLLLKLGVGMVVISGLLFATTTWNTISNLVKLILLLILGTVFIGLSFFSEKKLKLNKTTQMYWVLGCSFYLLTWIAVCHFEYFGSLFSYTGELSDLAYLTTYLIATIILFITSKKFDVNNLLYLVYAGIYFIIYHFLNYIGIDYMMTMLIITIISLICNLVIKKNSNNYLSQVSKLVSYFLFFLIVDNYHAYSPILTFLTAITSIINLGILSMKSDHFIDSLLIPSMIYIYLYIGVSNLELTNYSNLLFAFLFSCLAIFIRFTKEKQRTYQVINSSIYLIAMLIFYFSSVNQELELLLINAIYLITNLINSIHLKKSSKQPIDYYLQIIPITLLIPSITEIVDYDFFTVMMVFSIISIVYGLMYTITKDKQKKIYQVAFLLSIIFNILMNFITQELIPSMTLLLSASYLFIRNYRNKEQEQSVSVLSYIILLVSIFQTSILIDINILSNYKEVISSIIMILIYGILLLIFRKKNPYEIITNLAMIVPMYYLIDSYVSSDNLNLVLENIVQFYILYLLVRYVCKNTSAKNMLTLLGVIFIVIQVIFESGIYTGIYVGIVGIVVIILGYLNKTNKALFNVGIIITVVNIIYQLQNLWESIPFWLYLLIVGLGLILFVTYKETKKIDKEKDN